MCLPPGYPGKGRALATACLHVGAASPEASDAPAKFTSVACLALKSPYDGVPPVAGEFWRWIRERKGKPPRAAIGP